MLWFTEPHPLGTQPGSPLPAACAVHSLQEVSAACSGHCWGQQGSKALALPSRAGLEGGTSFRAVLLLQQSFPSPCKSAPPNTDCSSALPLLSPLPACIAAPALLQPPSQSIPHPRPALPWEIGFLPFPPSGSCVRSIPGEEETGDEMWAKLSCSVPALCLLWCPGESRRCSLAHLGSRAGKSPNSHPRCQL